MTRINLLPWREARRAKRQRDLLAMLAAAALGAIGLVFAAYVEVNHRIEYQQERNNYLRGEIARLKKAAEELQELQKPRTGWWSVLTSSRNYRPAVPAWYGCWMSWCD